MPQFAVSLPSLSYFPLSNSPSTFSSLYPHLSFPLSLPTSPPLPLPTQPPLSSLTSSLFPSPSPPPLPPSPAEKVMLLAHFTTAHLSIVEELFLGYCFCNLIGLMMDSKMEVSVRARYCIENTGREGLKVSRRKCLMATFSTHTVFTSFS